MLDVQKLIIQAMKNELFENKELNKSARIILAELKTKCKDVREEITTDIQYKFLQKMKKDRENSVTIYTDAFEKTNSDVAKNNLETVKTELIPLNYFLTELESTMPKKLSDNEIKLIINEIINSFNDKPNMGMIMKELKKYPNIDMSIASRLVKETL